MYFKVLTVMVIGLLSAPGWALDWDRVEFFRPQTLSAGSSLLVRSLGPTKIEIEWKSEADVKSIRVEGPLDAPEIVSDSAKASQHVELEKKGLYRITPQLETGKVELTTTCLKNCFRKEISPQEAWSTLKNSEALPIIRLAHQKLKDLSQDRETQVRLASGLVGHFKALKERKRFPVLPPIHTLSNAQGLLGGFEAAKPMAPIVLSGSLEKLIEEGMKAPYADPTPIADGLTTLYGHYTDRSIPEVVLKQSPVIAQVFTSLAAGKGTKIEWKTEKKTYELTSPLSFAQALLATGHHIELQSERTYANFIALVRDGNYIRWPAWFDSGIPLKSGHSLQVPMGHSQQAWLIRGPVVNARIAFFLGINGVGFFANIDERPSWTGMTARHFTQSDSVTNQGMILASFIYSTRYQQRVHADLAGPAKGVPASGYGFLGVCNDSNAFVEYSVFGTRSTYPWVRAASLLVKGSKDPIDLIFNDLPGDTTLKAQDLQIGMVRKQTLCRIQGMLPYRLAQMQNHFDDPELIADLKEVADEVGDDCSR